MDREEILAMGPGIELDVEIAKLLGKPIYRNKQGRWLIRSMMRSLDKTPEPYSRDISPAWQVVEKMWELGYSVSLLSRECLDLKYLGAESWYCDFRPKLSTTLPPEYAWVDHQNAAPEAICKAGLLAKLEVKSG